MTAPALSMAALFTAFTFFISRRTRTLASAPESAKKPVRDSRLDMTWGTLTLVVRRVKQYTALDFCEARVRQRNFKGRADPSRASCRAFMSGIDFVRDPTIRNSVAQGPTFLAPPVALRREPFALGAGACEAAVTPV